MDSGEAKNLSVPTARQHLPTIELELLGIWRRLLKREDLTIDDDFFECGGDSLLAIEMLLEVEQAVGYPIPASLMFQGETIRLLAPKVAKQVSFPEGPCAVFNAEGDQPPLFIFLHSDLNEGSFVARRLLRFLASNQPIILIEPHGARGEHVPRSIEQMALDRMQVILELQPHGSFRILGSCKGALIAFEMAHRLTRTGRRVEFVGLIDAPTANAQPSMRLVLSLLKHVASPAALAWVYDQMNRYGKLPKLPWKQRLAKAKTLITKARSVAVSPSPALNKIYTPIMARYRPEPLAAPLVFYAAEFDGHKWRNLSAHLSVIELPGEHNSCISVGAEVLANDLQQRWCAR